MGKEETGLAGKKERIIAALGRQLLRFGLLAILLSLFIQIAIAQLPGDPVALRLKNPDPVLVAAERARLGLDKPFFERTVLGWYRFVQGDWGESLSTGRPVRTDFLLYLPATLELTFLALVVGSVAGISLALAAVASPWKGLNIFLRMLASAGLSLPVFWLALMFILFGSFYLGWFPSGGRADWQSISYTRGFLTLNTLLKGDFSAFFSACRHLFLPVLTLSLYPAAVLSRLVYSRLDSVEIRPLLLALRARGLSPSRLYGKHLLRVSTTTAVTALGSLAGSLLGGAVLTETVFAWPGMGRYLVQAVVERDLAVVENALLATVLGAFLLVRLMDGAARAADPVMRRSQGKGGM